jgi:hypothetical protein
MRDYEFNSQEAVHFAEMLLQAARKLEEVQQNTSSPYMKVLACPGSMEVRVETSTQTFEMIG